MEWMRNWLAMPFNNSMSVSIMEQSFYAAKSQCQDGKLIRGREALRQNSAPAAAPSGRPAFRGGLHSLDRVAGDGTSRRQADGVDGISAAGGANRKEMIGQIGQQILLGGHVHVGLVVFQRPFLFGRVEVVQVFDANCAVTGGSLFGFGHGLSGGTRLATGGGPCFQLLFLLLGRVAQKG